ncbi:Sensory box histidine kinase/response regulator [Anaerovibrio sp. JC8]|uniref:ATP-binding protein n=1 Tax=Anaerovibrio sp. JC8 TaxID=1240085 RepID=UPI000A0DEE39|nr:ATP-binding protein [Anaerovibrio sp. JC8]ORT99905.1 Sensory box histidine kinase/response regulator [Anaerovibrio sp. JC8]
MSKKKNSATTSFLFNISHKMLTPLNAMAELTNTLENNLDDEEKARECIKKIRESHTFMQNLINNVLDTARLESGIAVVEETYGNINVLMNSIAKEFKGLMKRKNIRFSTNIDIKHPDVMVDFTKVKGILLNLISNAHKYTPEGGKIHINVRELNCDKPDYALYETTISDTGSGIPQEALPHLFDAFSSGGSSSSGGILSTGLGMHIVKELVNVLDGTITVKTREGEGTDFIVTLPHRLNTQITHDMRILLAEDNELNADIAIALLEDRGFKVERAVDGVQCVEMLRGSEPGYYDIILMDVEMPHMDGHKATKIIRRLKDSVHSTIPIIAMTANASDEDKRKTLLVGMNAHVAKPFDVDKLYATIFNVLAHKTYYIQTDGLETFRKKYTNLGCKCGFFIYYVDWDEQITYADQGTAEIFGCANEAEFLQLVGGTFKTLVHANDIEQVQKSITQQQESSSMNLDLVDYDVIRKDGQIRHLADIGYKVFDGERLVYFVYIADITDINKK